MTSLDPKACVVLVPCGEAIAAPCEDSLRVLESRGYEVRRIRGFSQIDVARNTIASNAVRDGFGETLWIDSDVGFNPDDVEKLRNRQLPIVAGIYAKKAKRELACKFLDDTKGIQFGKKGGLIELMYAATGFLHVRREVYLDIQHKLNLPTCNLGFGEAIVPWFQPLIREYKGNSWYLGEDFAFCERARQAGFRIMADTSIRLWHIGSYPYGWEDASGPTLRYSAFELKFEASPSNPA